MSPAPDRPSASSGQRRPDQRRVVRDSLLAGSVAGIASTLACHPFDVIRTKMQTTGMTATGSSGAGAAGSGAAAVAARGPLSLVSHTLAHGGVRALYTGLALPLAAQAVYKGTIFTVNGVARSALTERRARGGTLDAGAAAGPRELTLGDAFLCGFAGGAVNAALFVTPVEYVRNQLIAQHTRLAAAGGVGVGQGPASRARWEGPLDVVRHVVSGKRGVLGLWRGAAITVARDSVGCGCFFLAVEWTGRRLRPPSPSGSGSGEKKGGPPSSHLATSIASGALAGLAYWAAALPLDALKTWVQTDAVPSAAAGLRASLREHGAAGTAGRLLRGWPAAYARGVPSAAITVTTYSLCHGALAGKEGR